MSEQGLMTHFVINYICIEDVITDEKLIKNGDILVGVTDNQRWKNAIAIGDSGVNELTWMSVTITENGAKEDRRAPNESAQFFQSDPQIPMCPFMYQFISELFEIAHQIRNEKLNEKQAKERYFGYKITKKNSYYDTKTYF